MSKLFNEAPTSQLVEECAEQLARQLGGSSDQTKTQLRRFYQEYVGLRERITDDETYKRYEPKLKMMLSKAAYARRGGGRDAKIPEAFYNWFVGNIKSIQSHTDVIKFGQYFEAVVGYYYNYANEVRVGGRR